MCVVLPLDFNMTNRIIIAIVCVLALAQPVQADVIRGATAVSTTAQTRGTSSLSYLINQSGLSATYTSGVTNFADFIATTTTTNPGGTYWMFTGTTAVISFDLGAVYQISGAALWQAEYGEYALATGGSGNQNVRAVSFYTDNDMSFANGTTGTIVSNLAVGDSLQTNSASNIYASAINFGGTVSTRYLQMVVLSNGGDTAFTRIGEIAFDGVVVPEPNSIALLLAGIVLMGAATNRLRSQQ